MSGFPWDEETTSMEKVVKEMTHNYDTWLTSIITPMSSGQILCVHHIPIEQTEPGKCVTKTEWHILDLGQTCFDPGINEQYTRR